MSKLTLVTGANGFVGHAILLALEQNQFLCRAAVRSKLQVPAFKHEVSIGNIDSETDWSSALKNVEIIVHTAGRAHVLREKQSDAMNDFKKVNVDGTKNLALQAAQMGVKHFIFISSVKVNGEFSNRGQPYRESSVPNPTDPYGISKYEAELGLKKIASEFGMSFTIIRPPLIYGPGVKANFFNLMKLLVRGYPLPFGAFNNKRSFLALDNLVDLIICCIKNSASKNQTFLVSDGVDLSTPDLLRMLSLSLGKKLYLVNVPEWMLKIGAFCFGKTELLNRLCTSLQVDMSYTQRILDWVPAVSIDYALNQTAKDFLERYERYE